MADYRHGYLHPTASDLNVLVDELSPVKSNWEALGQKFWASPYLEIIRSIKSYPGDLEGILKEWLIYGRPNCSWRDVLRALRSVGEVKLVNKLKVKYGLLEECDLDVVTEELDGVSTKWHLLGEHLQVPMDELNSIRHVRDSSHENCLRKVLRFWLESYYTPTWSFIVLFLRVFNFDSQLTDHLEVKYCSSLLHESHLGVIVNELSTVSAKWGKLGEEFGFRVTDFRWMPPADGLKEILRCWLQQDKLKTWSHIVLALKSRRMGESQLGDHLKEKYLPETCPPLRCRGSVLCIAAAVVVIVAGIAAVLIMMLNPHSLNNLTPTVHCHSILRVQELDKAVAEIGEWEPLCENLGAPVPVVNQLRSDSIPPGSKKRQCLKGYIDLGTACWETVVQVVADHPFYNKKLAKKIADDNGIDYSTIVRDDL